MQDHIQNPHRYLALKVIEKAMQDLILAPLALKKQANRQSLRPQDVVAIDAYQWVTAEDAAVAFWCDAADIQPSLLYRQAREILHAHGMSYTPSIEMKLQQAG